MARDWRVSAGPKRVSAREGRVSEDPIRISAREWRVSAVQKWVSATVWRVSGGRNVGLARELVPPNRKCHRKGELSDLRELWVDFFSLFEILEHKNIKLSAKVALIPGTIVKTTGPKGFGSSVLNGRF